MASLPGRSARGVDVRLIVEIVDVVPICFYSGDPLDDGVRCQQCTYKWCGYGLRERFGLFCASSDGNSSMDAPNPNFFNDLPNVFNHPPQPQYELYSCKLCGNDAHYGYDCPSRVPLDDDDEESTIPLNEITSQIPPSIAITPVLPTLELGDSLIMGDENLSTILEKESDEFIKSSIKDLVPILSEFKDTSWSDSECDYLPVMISLPLMFLRKNLSLSITLYSIQMMILPLVMMSHYPMRTFLLENIKSKDSYVSKLDEPVLLVTPLSKLNEDECFDPGGDIDEIDAFLDINGFYRY
ncbi:hypothetical protein Tco_1162164 [Tanacetum coccineum]